MALSLLSAGVAVAVVLFLVLGVDERNQESRFPPPATETHGQLEAKVGRSPV
ncbi:MAG: hypothetical protein H0V11_07470 [Actinobacteria bacterium]|nr:hypothetical protein [Actinomycetota bacterium]